MDFFNEIMKFGDIFESQETIDELKDISDEIKKYDVYDVLARISGLNLMPHETEFDYSVLSAWDSNLTVMRLFFCLHPSRCSRAAERMNNENT